MEATKRIFKTIKGTTLVISENIKETEKAVYRTVMNVSGGYNNEFWIPKSVISFIENEVVIPEWFIKKNFTKVY